MNPIQDQQKTFPYQVSLEKAEKAISSNGSIIKKGGAKKRLVLQDPRLNLAFATLSNRIFDSLIGRVTHNKRCIKAVIDGNPLILNVKSLERLNISAEMLRSHTHTPEQLGSLIIKSYANLSAMYQERERIKKEGPETLRELQEDNLLKLVHTAWNTPLQSEEKSRGGVISLKEPNGKQKFLYTRDNENGHVYAFPLNDKAHPFIENLGKELGHGNFTTVYDIEEYTKIKDVSAIKIAKHDNRHSAEDLLKEARIVQKLHTNYTGDNLAIMKTPVAEIDTHHISHICATLTSKFTYNAEDYIKNHKPTLEKLKEYFDLLDDALDYIHEQQIYHGDIKLTNIFYDKISESFKFLDFGGSFDPSESSLELLNENKKALLSWTPEYSFQSSVKAILQFAEKNDLENYTHSLEIRDRIALRLAFLESLCIHPDFCFLKNTFSKLFTYYYRADGTKGCIGGFSSKADSLINDRITNDDAKALAKDLVEKIKTLDLHATRVQ